MNLLIDTNRYTDLARGVPEVVERMEAADAIWRSLVVLGELRAGFAAGTKTTENEAALERFRHQCAVSPLALDEETTDYCGFVHSALRRKGKMIPTNDVWVAAQALQHQLTLDTRDQHFQHVPGLKLLKSE